MQTQDVDPLMFALTLLFGQCVHLVALAVSEYVPPVTVAPGHAVQGAGPVVSLYVPASHGEHGPLPSGPVYPAGHVSRQAALDVLAGDEVEPAVQFVHGALPFVPLYFPAVQDVHATHVVSVKSTPSDI